MTPESHKPVALISMPTLSARFPSFQLALLKPTLEREGIPVQTFSLFMYFGTHVGWRINETLSDVYPCMLGEWIWTKAAFGDFANDDDYFNLYRGNLEAICREAGLGRYLSAAVDSTEVGRAKPDPAIFYAALDRLSAGADEAVFIGDSPARDMAGARGVGMRHVLVAGEAFNGFQPCCPGDSRIRGVDELAEMFL